VLLAVVLGSIVYVVVLVERNLRGRGCFFEKFSRAIKWLNYF